MDTAGLTSISLSHFNSELMAAIHKGTADLAAYSSSVPQNMATIQYFRCSSGHWKPASPLDFSFMSIFNRIGSEVVIR